MKKLNERSIKLLLTVSILINTLFLGYIVKRILWKYKSKQETELNVNGFKKNKYVAQPDTVYYFIKRNEVFFELPNDAEEIVMLGTSLTHNFEWHEIFKNVNIKNRGINGDITKGILQRIDEILDSKPKKIFIEMGVNDILCNYDIDSAFYNYTLIIQTIKTKSPKTRIYIQSIIPTTFPISNTHFTGMKRIPAFNKMLKTYCLNNDITYIDLYSKFLSVNKLNPLYDCGDHLHLNGKGYMEWCKLIEVYIHEK